MSSFSPDPNASFFIPITRARDELAAFISLCGAGETKAPAVATDHISCGIAHQARDRTKWGPAARQTE